MKIIFIPLLLCFLLSCGNSVPSGIIPPEKMETILWQLMQTDEFTATAFTRDSTKNLTVERIRRYRQVFRLNQTSKDDFSKSYTYYMAHPDIAKMMFDSIGARAMRQHDTVNRPKPFIRPNNIKPLPRTLPPSLHK